MALLLEDNRNLAFMGYTLLHTLHFAYSLSCDQFAKQSKLGVLFNLACCSIFHREYGHITFLINFQRGKQNCNHNGEVLTSYVSTAIIYAEAVLNALTCNDSIPNNVDVRCGCFYRQSRH